MIYNTRGITLFLYLVSIPMVPLNLISSSVRRLSRALCAITSSCKLHKTEKWSYCHNILVKIKGLRTKDEPKLCTSWFAGGLCLAGRCISDGGWPAVPLAPHILCLPKNNNKDYRKNPTQQRIFFMLSILDLELKNQTHFPLSFKYKLNIFTE